MLGLLFSFLCSLPRLSYMQMAQIFISLAQTSLSFELEYLKAYSFHLHVTMILQTWHVQNGTHVVSRFCPLPTHFTKSACVCSPSEWIIAWSVELQQPSFMIFLPKYLFVFAEFFFPIHHLYPGSSHNLLLLIPSFCLLPIWSPLQPEWFFSNKNMTSHPPT